MYTVDKRAADSERWEYGAKMPWAFGVDMSPSSVEGCTRVTPVLPLLDDATLEVRQPHVNFQFFFPSVHMTPELFQLQVCNDLTKGWDVKLDVPLTSSSSGQTKRLRVDFNIEAPREPLSLMLPLETNGTAVVLFVGTMLRRICISTFVSFLGLPLL